MIWILLGVVALFGVSLLFYMNKQATQENIMEQTLAFPDFPESFGKIRIFFISDIHKRKINSEFIDKISNIDLVIIGGDLTEKKVPLEQVSENIKQLKKLGIVFFVWGNNDYEVDYHELDSLLLHHGVKILDNSSYLFESEQGHMLELVGVDDMVHERDELETALEETKRDSFKILVSHEPEIVDKFTEKEKISLVLSGHTHGGQIRIFGFGPHERGGLTQMHHTTQLISNGFGTSLVPLRLGAPPETHILTITTRADA
ncbi:metallophosphoesterase [Sutcliffiella horikoshii]|uniref:Metallophosphoesterase n=1 Tax=Sutcliffiella horikoshii TaxID=79883 RepID=A0A5D4SYJ0_9BACI|nr:metallophosphoesterase [Sutcliffiella horikoshii]TYS68365.1 metallophosphoesterase [Sutcliffiella horikoshii]